MIIRVDPPTEEEAHAMVWKGCSLWELLLVRMGEWGCERETRET